MGFKPIWFGAAVGQSDVGYKPPVELRVQTNFAKSKATRNPTTPGIAVISTPQNPR
jgi:hypothetical protein